MLRAGRITPAQQRALDELLPRFGIAYAPAALDLDRVFGRAAPRVLEIGFGNGDTLVELAARSPERDFIGVEVHPPGIGHCLLAVESHGLANVRVIVHDAVEVLAHQVAAGIARRGRCSISRIPGPRSAITSGASSSPTSWRSSRAG